MFLRESLCYIPDTCAFPLPKQRNEATGAHEDDVPIQEEQVVRCTCEDAVGAEMYSDETGGACRVDGD